MSGALRNLFGGAGQDGSAGKGDADFADFAPHSNSGQQVLRGPGPGLAVPYTRWYRVWERTSPKDFVQEAFVVPFTIVVILLHLWGAKKNRRKAKAWAEAHAPILCDEFAVVGYDGISRNTTSNELVIVDEIILKEKSLSEFATYATGRQNVAFADVTVKMVKRYNPMLLFGDMVMSFFFESFIAPSETAEIVVYPFDGKEKDLVPTIPAEKDQLEKRSKVNNSAYDNFVFAVVHKSLMQRLRDDRYDVSLAPSKDNAKLPERVTVMSESAEITDSLLTAELIQVIEKAGDIFEYLIISDQPVDKPKSVEEANPRKRLILSLRLPTSASEHAASAALLKVFIRLADRLVNIAHFRPEVAKKLRAIREEEVKKMKRAEEEEKAEERKIAAEKLKKEERDRILRSMSAEEQRKFLEKEKGKDQKREMKRFTKRG